MTTQREDRHMVVLTHAELLLLIEAMEALHSRLSMFDDFNGGDVTALKNVLVEIAS